MANFICDGHNELIHLEPSPSGLHDGFDFEFRELEGPEQQEIVNRLAALGPKQRVKLQLETVVDRLVSWGDDRPISEETVRKMRPALYQKVCNIIMSFRGGDVAKPEGEEETDTGGN